MVGLLALGAYLGWQYRNQQNDPCLSRCGEGTECNGAVCVARVVPKPTVKQKRKKRKRWRRKRKKASGSISENPTETKELRTPGPAELKAQARGPSLSGTEVIAAGDISEGAKELSQAQVDARFNALRGRIVACIDRARGDWDIRQGEVKVAFRLERTGKVSRVKVTAPAVMQRGDIYGCIKPLVTGLRFPPSGRTLVMSYPFSLR